MTKLSLTKSEKISFEVIFLLYNLLIFLYSFWLFFNVRAEYDNSFCWLVFGLYIAQVVPFVYRASRRGYVNFYALFFTSFLFINFFYPCILYPIDANFFSIFTISFNEDYINQGTALAQISASSLIMGALIPFKLTKESTKRQALPKYTSHLMFSQISIVLFVAFIATVGGDFLAGSFTSRSQLSLYILQVLSCCMILSSIFFFQNFKRQPKKVLYYALVCCYLLLFLKVGDRGPALSLIILICGLYSAYIRKISIFYLLILGIIGGSIFHVIGIGRSSEVINDNENVLTRGVTSLQEQNDVQLYYAITESLVVNNRNLYVGTEYVDRHGVNYGSTSLFPGFLAVVPFAQGVYEKITKNKIRTSGQFFTRLAFGENPSYGLGTNLVADVYISFGLMGSVILFFALGRSIEFFRKSTLTKFGFIATLFYFYCLSNSIYWPRSGYFVPLKIFIWSIVIYYFVQAAKNIFLLRLNHNKEHEKTI